MHCLVGLYGVLLSAYLFPILHLIMGYHIPLWIKSERRVYVFA